MAVAMLAVNVISSLAGGDQGHNGTRLLSSGRCNRCLQPVAVSAVGRAPNAVKYFGPRISGNLVTAASFPYSQRDGAIAESTEFSQNTAFFDV